MKKGRLNRINTTGYFEVKSRLETLLLVLNSNFSDKEKVQLLKTHISESLENFKKENGHLAG